MMIFLSWMDYLITILVLVIACQFGIIIGIKLQEHYG